MWEGMVVWRCVHHRLCVCVCEGRGGGAPTANRDKSLGVGVRGYSVVVRDCEGGGVWWGRWKTFDGQGCRVRVGWLEIEKGGINGPVGNVPWWSLAP